MTKKMRWGRLLLAGFLFVGACSGDDDGARVDATPEIDAAPPYPPDYRDTYVMARNCRNSTSHELHRIVVWAAPEGADAYIAQEGERPEGMILLTEEYDFADDTCQDEVIRTTIASAVAYTLLGVIQQADGKRDAAAEAFRRALYIDPEHAEAISHMIVICERKGQASQAEAFRRRLAKLQREEAK
jgi:Flp pilus assembly protein TadD